MEVLQIGIPKWNITELSGYEPITTFWQDFSIADKLGINDIEETYECIKSEWKDDFKYWTELCLVLNHKIWQWYERDNQKAVLYDKLWREADEMTSEWSDEKTGILFSSNRLKPLMGKCKKFPHFKPLQDDYPKTNTESN